MGRGMDGIEDPDDPAWTDQDLPDVGDGTDMPRVQPSSACRSLLAMVLLVWVLGSLLGMVLVRATRRYRVWRPTGRAGRVVTHRSRAG